MLTMNYLTYGSYMMHIIKKIILTDLSHGHQIYKMLSEFMRYYIIYRIYLCLLFNITNSFSPWVIDIVT